MGQIESVESESRRDSHGEVGDLVSFIRSQAVDIRKTATLTFEDFNRYVVRLNALCRNCVDAKGKFLMFAIRKGSADTLLWKATINICCLKVEKSTGKIDSGRCVDLPTFLSVHQSLVALLCGPDRSKQAATSSTASADLLQRANFEASIFMDHLDEVKGTSDLSHECCICMERKPDVLLPCAHCYCLPCIEQWNVSNSFCPTCRERLNDTDDAWIISDIPEQSEIADYLLSLTE